MSNLFSSGSLKITVFLYIVVTTNPDKNYSRCYEKEENISTQARYDERYNTCETRTPGLPYLTMRKMKFGLRLVKSINNKPEQFYNQPRGYDISGCSEEWVKGSWTSPNRSNCCNCPAVHNGDYWNNVCIPLKRLRNKLICFIKYYKRIMKISRTLSGLEKMNIKMNIELEKEFLDLFCEIINASTLAALFCEMTKIYSEMKKEKIILAKNIDILSQIVEYSTQHYAGVTGGKCCGRNVHNLNQEFLKIDKKLNYFSKTTNDKLVPRENIVAGIGLTGFAGFLGTVALACTGVGIPLAIGTGVGTIVATTASILPITTIETKHEYISYAVNSEKESENDQFWTKNEYRDFFDQTQTEIRFDLDQYDQERLTQMRRLIYDEFYHTRLNIQLAQIIRDFLNITALHSINE